MRSLPANAVIFILAFAVGIGAAVYLARWSAWPIFSAGTFLGLSLLYALLAWPLGWPKLRWREFFGDLIGLLLAPFGL
jgi:hypothetical protein